MTRFQRAHEWLADRVSWVQYPNVRGPKQPFFKHEMPIMNRVALALFGAGLVVVSLIALSMFCLLFWALLFS